jgi:hypothetical protein
MTRSGLAAFALICAITTSPSAYAQGTEPHGWLNTEMLKTRSGDFEFKNGYPLATRPNDCSICKNSIERSRFI